MSISGSELTGTQDHLPLRTPVISGKGALSVKKEIIPSLILTALAAVLAAGSQTFLSPCVHEDGSFGACHWAGQMLLGLGLCLAAIGLICLSVRRARFGAYLSALPVCVLSMVTPGTLVDLCRMSTMRCRMIMQPAAVILSAACFVCAAAGAALSAGSRKR